jgi:hypothetical protein
VSREIPCLVTRSSVTALSLPPGLLQPTIGHELRNKKISKNNKTLKNYEFAGRKFNN